MPGEKRSDKRLLVRAYYTEYGYGDALLKGWEFVKTDDENLKITRANGSTFTAPVGQMIKNNGRIEIDDHGNMHVGQHRILAGVNLLHEWRAKKSRKKGEYTYMHLPTKFRKKVVFGETIDGLGVPSGLDEHGNISVGMASIPVEPKIMELKLMVFDSHPEVTQYGFEAGIHLIEPSKGSSSKHRTNGIFYPAKGNRPAVFCEHQKEHGSLSTAVFFPSKKEGFMTAKTRSIDSAIAERTAYNEMKSFAEEAKSAGIAPEDHFDYAVAKERLESIQQTCWTAYPFTISLGKELFQRSNQAPDQTNDQQQASGNERQEEAPSMGMG